MGSNPRQLLCMASRHFPEISKESVPRKGKYWTIFRRSHLPEKSLYVIFPKIIRVSHLPEKKQRQQAGQVRVLIARIEGIQVLHCVWWSGQECFRKVKNCIFEAQRRGDSDSGLLEGDNRILPPALYDRGLEEGKNKPSFYTRKLLDTSFFTLVKK